MPCSVGSALIVRMVSRSSAWEQPPREKKVPGGDAHLVGRPLLVAHVDLGGGIVADEDHGQPRLHRGLGAEGSDTGLDLGQDLRRDLLA